MAGNFGMMNDAYFVGKNVLLDWINVFLDVRIEKVEQMCTGSLYCNLFDALHPGSIVMKKVDFTCKYEYEYVNNWKLLQTAFEKIGIEKPIPVQKLIKGRYQDNLEFFQWMYKYAHEVYKGDVDGRDYDAAEARAKSKGGKDFSGNGKTAVKQVAKKAPNTGRTSTLNTNSCGNPPSVHVAGNPRTSSTRPHPDAEATKSMQRKKDDCPEDVVMTDETSGTNNNHRNLTTIENDNNANNFVQRQELDTLKQDNTVLRERIRQMEVNYQELSTVAKEIEKERDFYFRKVCEVEELCKSYSDQSLPLLDHIYNNLYQTCDEVVNVQTNENDHPIAQNKYTSPLKEIQPCQTNDNRMQSDLDERFGTQKNNTNPSNVTGKSNGFNGKSAVAFDIF